MSDLIDSLSRNLRGYWCPMLQYGGLTLRDHTMFKNNGTLTDMDASTDWVMSRVKGRSGRVNFWAEWCGPCRAVAPILEEISNEYSGKIKIVKLNTDEEGTIAMKYGINSIPTMNVFVGGQVVKSIVGARPKPALVRELAEYLG